MKWRNLLGLLKDLKISLESEIKPTKNGQEPVKTNLFCKFNEFCKRVQRRFRLSKSENFTRHFENSVGDSEQTYSFLNLLRRVRKTSENISRVKEKSGGRSVNKVGIANANAFNECFAEIRKN